MMNTVQKLETMLNNQDGLFQDIDDVLVHLCEELGIDPSNYDFKIRVYNNDSK